MRHSRRWSRRLILVTGLGVIAFLTIAQAPAPTATTIKGSRFVLVNQAGDEVAEFGLVDSSPALSFLDGLKHPFTQLTASKLVIGTPPDNAMGRVQISTEGLWIEGMKREGMRQASQVVFATDSGPRHHYAGGPSDR